MRISAIVDARFSLIVDGETVSSRTRRGGAQALGLNVAQSSTISLKPPRMDPVAGPVVFVLYITRFQIQPEERALQAIFGEDFGRYAARIRRWL